MRGLTDGHYNAQGERYPRFKVQHCPACNQPLKTHLCAPIEVLTALRLGFVVRILITSMVESYPRPVQTVDLIDKMWPANGKPSDPTANVKQAIMRMRRRIAPYGWAIVSTLGGYKLQPKK